MASLVASEMARTNRNLLLTAAGLGLAALIVLIPERHVFASLLLGPKPIGVADIGTAPARSRTQLIVTAKGDRAMASGFTAKTLGGGTTTATYSLLSQGDKLLVVKTSGSGVLPETEATGELTDFDELADFSVRSSLEKDPKVGQRLLPVMLNAADYRSSRLIELILLLGALGAAATMAFRVERRLRDPSRHPIRVALARLGDVEDWSAKIDDELQRPGAVTIHRARVTETMLLHSGIYGFTVIPLASVVWVYAKARDTKKFLITIARDWTLCVALRDGSLQALRISEHGAALACGAVARRIPWVFNGWRADLEREWKRDPTQVVRAVDEQRRRQGS